MRYRRSLRFCLGTKRRSWVLAAGIAVGLTFILAIGFRYQVGGDWFNYLRHYNRAIGTPLREIAISDPGYAFLNWVMARWRWGIYGVNTACGAIFMIGLLVYCRQLPAPWLGFAVAVPYLIVVMAMGYTRQSVALGFFFLALAAVERGHFLQYLLWVALGATFHKSAVLLVPLGIFLYGKGCFCAAWPSSQQLTVFGIFYWRSIRSISGRSTWTSRCSRRGRR